ncbi:MAG: protein phosphatase 2C domain-containing protein, partial [Gammaproteobacteria bacterium]
MKLKDKIEMVGLTDTGLVRDHNEDAIGNDLNLGLAVLADGMGGHRGGEVASAITVSTILETLAEKLKRIEHNVGNEAGSYRPESIAVNDAIIQANAKVFASSRDNSHYRGMGTTVVVLLFHDDHFTVAHVGDSRLYRYRDGHLEQMTNDHSLTQELLDSGLYTT